MSTVYQVQTTPTQILTGFQSDYIQLTNTGTGLIYYGNDSSGLQASKSSLYVATLQPFLEPGASIVIDPYTEIWAYFSGLTNYNTIGVGTLTATTGVSNKIAYSQSLRTIVRNQVPTQAGTTLGIYALTYDPSISGNVQSVTVILENLATSISPTPETITISYDDGVASVGSTGTVVSTTTPDSLVMFAFNATSFSAKQTAIMSVTFPVQGTIGVITISSGVSVAANAFQVSIVANGYSVPKAQTKQTSQCLSGVTQYGNTYSFSTSGSFAAGVYYYPLPIVNNDIASITAGFTIGTSGGASVNNARLYARTGASNYTIMSATIVTASVLGFANNTLNQIYLGKTANYIGFTVNGSNVNTTHEYQLSTVTG